MALLIPTVGEKLMCELILANDVKCHLYSNDITPGKSDVIGDYTLITNPAAKTLVSGTWDYDSIPGTATYAQQDFVIPGTETVYGYVVTNSAGTIVLWAERSDSAPYNFGSDGGTMNIDPKYTQS